MVLSWRTPHRWNCDSKVYVYLPTNQSLSCRKTAETVTEATTLWNVINTYSSLYGVDVLYGAQAPRYHQWDALSQHTHQFTHPTARYVDQCAFLWLLTSIFSFEPVMATRLLRLNMSSLMMDCRGFTMWQILITCATSFYHKINSVRTFDNYCVQIYRGSTM